MCQSHPCYIEQDILSLPFTSNMLLESNVKRIHLSLQTIGLAVGVISLLLFFVMLLELFMSQCAVYLFHCVDNLS